MPACTALAAQNPVGDFYPSRDFARASRINQTYKRSGNATELLTLLVKERSAAPAQSIGQRFRPPRSLVSVCAQDDVGAMRACLDSLLKRRGADLALAHLQRVQDAPPSPSSSQRQARHRLRQHLRGHGKADLPLRHAVLPAAPPPHFGARADCLNACQHCIARMWFVLCRPLDRRVSVVAPRPPRRPKKVWRPWCA